MKEGEGISQEHICTAHGHRQQCGDGQGGGGMGAGRRGTKGEKMGISAIGSTRKAKEKNGKDTYF